MCTVLPFTVIKQKLPCYQLNYRTSQLHTGFKAIKASILFAVRTAQVCEKDTDVKPIVKSCFLFSLKSLSSRTLARSYRLTCTSFEWSWGKQLHFCITNFWKNNTMSKKCRSLYITLVKPINTKRWTKKSSLEIKFFSFSSKRKPKQFFFHSADVPGRWSFAATNWEAWMNQSKPFLNLFLHLSAVKNVNSHTRVLLQIKEDYKRNILLKLYTDTFTM